jgi:hypothetical protein
MSIPSWSGNIADGVLSGPSNMKKADGGEAKKARTATYVSQQTVAGNY